jgi:Domain of unknown function (DUF6438)
VLDACRLKPRGYDGISMSSRLAFGFLLALGWAGCSPAVPEDFEITYENRGPGEGIPQEYRFTLSSGGALTYEGRLGVKAIGVHRTVIPVERVDGIRNELDQLGFFRLQDGYHEGSDGVEQSIRVTCAGRTKSVDFDDMASFVALLTPQYCKEIGMEYQPMTDVQFEHLRLEKFSNMLQKTLGIERWIGTQEEKAANHFWLERDRASPR